MSIDPVKPGFLEIDASQEVQVLNDSLFQKIEGCLNKVKFFNNLACNSQKVTNCLLGASVVVALLIIPCPALAVALGISALALAVLGSFSGLTTIAFAEAADVTTRRSLPLIIEGQRQVLNYLKDRIFLG